MEFIKKNYLTIMLLLIFIYVIGINRKIKQQNEMIETIQKNMITKKELYLEGLRNEKRMIQSTKRTIFDLEREKIIDKELQK